MQDIIEILMNAGPKSSSVIAVVPQPLNIAVISVTFVVSKSTPDAFKLSFFIEFFDAFKALRSIESEELLLM